MMNEQTRDEDNKINNILVQLNKIGLSYLKNIDLPQSIEYLKKAEKIIVQQLMIGKESMRLSQMAAITFNNLACYYKKAKKPKVALSYLKKSLEIEIYKLNDWVSISSTHLNICAIYSYLNKHEEAVNHVSLAIKLLEQHTPNKNSTKEQEKSFSNIKMLCYYNKAIQQEHLKYYSKSLQSYKQVKQLARMNQAKNKSLIQSCNEAIQRIENNFATMKKRMISLLLKKKEDEQYGHYQFMRNHQRTKEILRAGSHGSSAQLVKINQNNASRRMNVRLERIRTTNKESLAYLHDGRRQSRAQRQKYKTEQTETNC